MTYQATPLLLLLLTATSLGGTWRSPPLGHSSSLAEETVDRKPMQMEEKKTLTLICQENGVFPSLDSCRDYYYCSDWDGRGMQMYHFTCPQGTIFDDHFNTCRFPTVITTRPGCEKMNDDADYTIRDLSSVPVIERRKRSSPPEENCTLEVPEIVVEIVAASAKDTCILIYHVDKYVSLVRSRVPVTLPPSIIEEEFTSIVERYNSYLEIAQNHSYIWRHGNDIMSGIRRTYELAELFGPEFQRKYKIMQKRIKTLRVSPEIVILRAISLESDIARLKNESANIIALVVVDDSITALLHRYFLNRLEKISEDITRKEKELRELNMPVRKTLRLLVAFMEFVKNDASQIEVKANSTGAKIKTFRDHVLRDRAAFKSIMDMANKGILNTEIQRNVSLAIIEENKVKKEKAERDRKKQKEELRQLENEIDQEIERLKETLNKIHRDTSKQLSRHRSGRTWLILPVIGWIAGAIEMHKADTSMELLLRQKKDLFESFSQKQQLYESQVGITYQEIVEYNKKIVRAEEITKSESDRIHKLSYLDDYLQEVVSDAEMILPFINRALVSLGLMEEIFDTTVRNLETLINAAKEAKTEIESQNIQYVIYEGLSNMQSKWNASYTNIISLGKCTHNDFIHLLTQPPEPITTQAPEPITTQATESITTQAPEPITTQAPELITTQPLGPISIQPPELNTTSTEVSVTSTDNVDPLVNNTQSMEQQLTPNDSNISEDMDSYKLLVEDDYL